MKFYKPWLDDFDAPHKIYADMEESERGEYAARDDAEQAAKDAVEMAKLVQEVLMRFYQKLMWPGDPKMIEAACKQDVEWQDAKAIIERYEGGQDDGHR